MPAITRQDATSAPALVADRSARSALEDAFLDWLLGAAKPEQLHLDGPDAPPTQLTWMLGVLSTSSRPLPTEALEVLALPADTSLGAAATELLLAVNDPAGPRCRSYRSAVLYLREHHQLMVAFDEL